MNYHKNWPIPDVVQQRAVSNVVIQDGGCWDTLYCRMPAGYGTITHRTREDGKQVSRIYLAHRAAYVFANGPIPDGLVVDHMCFNKSCVNPAHLRAVNRIQNNQRKVADGVDWPLDQCRWGHPLSEQRYRGATVIRRDCPGCLKDRNDWTTALRKYTRLLEIAYGLGDWHTKRSYPRALRERQARVDAVSNADTPGGME